MRLRDASVLALVLVGVSCGVEPDPDAGPTSPDAGVSSDAGQGGGAGDAGVPDSGAVDAGNSDAGQVDAGAPDAGTPDAGTPDAGAADAGPVDSGVSDAGSPDAGAPDAGPPTGVVVYPAPQGETPSPRYQLEVLTDAGAQSVFVHFSEVRSVTTPGNPGVFAQADAGRSFSWATFETGEPVTVRVTTSFAFSSAVVRPSALGVSPTITGPSTAEFTLRPGQKVSFEPDTALGPCSYRRSTCVRDIFLVFADRRDSQDPLAGVPASDIYRPSTGSHATAATISGQAVPFVSTLGDAGGKRVVVFEPGVYDIGYWEVPPSVERVHIKGGAVVYGALNALPLGSPPPASAYLSPWLFTLRPSFSLSGHGILSGARIPWHATQDASYCSDDPCGWWRMVRLLRSNAAATTVDDVTLADSPYWTTDFVGTATLRNVKIGAQWAFNNDGVHLPANGVLADSFLQTNDDAVLLAGSNARVERCTFWQFENGASFQMGWYPKTISNIAVTDVDVIHAEWWWSQGNIGGVVAFATAAGNGVINDVRFTNLRVEGPLLRLVGLFPRGGQSLTNFQLQQVRVERWGNDIFDGGRYNWISAVDGGAVSGMTFTDFTVGAQPVTTSNWTTVGGFGTEGAVSGVTFGP